MWHSGVMNASGTEPLTPRLIDALYTEAMLLADEARSYFEDAGRADRAMLDPLTRVSFSCESLKVTTRLMHVIAWLLTRRAIDSGEIAGRGDVEQRPTARRRLGQADGSDEDVIARFPHGARTMIAASSDLYARVRRLERGGAVEAGPSPARALMSRLERSF